jgi:hypothetical protein
MLRSTNNDIECRIYVNIQTRRELVYNTSIDYMKVGRDQWKWIPYFVSLTMYPLFCYSPKRLFIHTTLKQLDFFCCSIFYNILCIK